MISDSYLNYYLRYLDNYPQLDKCKEKTLSLLVLGGTDDEKLMARDELVLGNLRLVVFVAKKYYLIFNKTIPIQDLIEYGNLGLIDAATRFDYNRAAFSTYAVMRINRRIQYGINERDLIHIPEHQKVMVRVMDREGKSIDEYCQEHNISDLQNERLHKNVDLKIVSIDSLVDFDNESYTFDIPDMTTDVEEDIDNNSLIDRIKKSINELKPRYRKLINDLYFRNITQRDLSREYGCSYQAIQNVQRRAMRVLKQKLLTIKDELI
jgi:RNA polymerase sigma factor (sigma-70 family)